MTSRSPATAPLSCGAVLAWKIAAAEARRTGSGMIEAPHLLIGLCSLEKALLTGDCSSNSPVTFCIISEKESLEVPLAAAGLDPAVLRRSARAALTRDTAPAGGRIIHRSLACKAVFDRAGQGTRGSEVTVIHLLAALVDDPDPAVRAAIDAAGGGAGSAPAASVRLREEVRASIRVQEEQVRLKEEVEISRATLRTVPRGSDAYERLRGELAAKNAQLARLCIRARDAAGLIPLLQEMAGEAPRGDIAGIIRQLEYMRDHDIAISDRSAALLQGMVQELAGPPGRQE